jgi:RNA polymerase sigma-70 factor (ECF subfamily)
MFNGTQVRQAEDLAPTRKSLLGRLRDRQDQESWRDFFETYWRLLYNAAVKSGLSDAEAQDAVQDTVIEVARTIDAFQHRGYPGSFRQWLLRLAGWRITDRLRRRQREQRILGPVATQSHPGSHTATIEKVADPAAVNVVQVLDEEWELHLFRLAMLRVKSTVDARQFQIFDLCVVQEWPVKKVAATLRVRPEVVYLAKHRVSHAIETETRRLQEANGGDLRSA